MGRKAVSAAPGAILNIVITIFRVSERLPYYLWRPDSCPYIGPSHVFLREFSDSGLGKVERKHRDCLGVTLRTLRLYEVTFQHNWLCVSLVIWLLCLLLALFRRRSSVGSSTAVLAFAVVLAFVAPSAFAGEGSRTAFAC